MQNSLKVESCRFSGHPAAEFFIKKQQHFKITFIAELRFTAGYEVYN